MFRLIIDLSTLVRWSGPPVGISRCQTKYAGYALRHIENAVFTVFDPVLRKFRQVTKESAGRIIDGRLKIDFSMAPDLNPNRRRTVDRVPQTLVPAYWWVTKFGRKLILALEDKRLSTRSIRWKKRIEALQAMLIGKKRRSFFYAEDGSRNDCPEIDKIVGAPLALSKTDTVLAIQNDWIHTDVMAIGQQKQAANFRHVILCHDIIPLQFPQWYNRSDVEGFVTYYDTAFALADRVMFTTERTAADATAYCRSIGVEILDKAVVPMGSDIRLHDSMNASLPGGLSPERYCLFVSTIEPRKNHVLLVDAWRNLTQQGIIDRHSFKMVFVGRRGWKMGTFLEDIGQDPLLKDSVIHLQDVDDSTLSVLYRNAAFCLYPPKFEGFGLPIIEALSYGKALLVSNAGPMPEIAGDFAIALDCEDSDAWMRAIGHWIEDEGARHKQAERVKREYRPMSWDESAKLFFEKVMAPFSSP